MSRYLKPRASFGTSTGQVRALNEDSALVSISPTNQRPARALLIVADGWMGDEGEMGVGQVASKLVVSTIHEALQDFLQQPKPDSNIVAWQLVERLYAAIAKANELLCTYQGEYGVVTGLAGVLIQNDLAAIVNNVDCRVYLLRNSQLRMITDNWLWPASGAIMGTEEAIHMNQWTEGRWKDAEFMRNASSMAAVQLNVWTESLEAGDRLLLCTDGLCGLVDENTIALCLSEAASPQMAVQQLIDAAQANGGVDNITAVVCDVVG